MSELEWTEVWMCNRCGNVERVEIYELGDGVLAEWACIQPIPDGSACMGTMEWFRDERPTVVDVQL